MPNRNYNKGRAKEYRIKKQLEKLDWFVIRSSGSHSPVDLVAFQPPDTSSKIYSRNSTHAIFVRFIQCKPKGGYLTPDERQEKKKLEDKLGINIEVL